jgi:hypothetical protein
MWGEPQACWDETPVNVGLSESISPEPLLLKRRKKIPQDRCISGSLHSPAGFFEVILLGDQVI